LTFTEFYRLLLGNSHNEDLLYHYTKSSNFFEHIYQNGTLRFNALRNMDDPYEKMHLAGAYSPDFDSSGEADRNHPRNQNALNELRENVCIASFSVDKRPRGFTASTGLYRGYAKPRMWIQYADKGNGVCLVFSKNKLLELLHKKILDSKRILHRKITYTDSISDKSLTIYGQNLVSVSDIQKYFRKHASTLLFSKNQDFRDEQEYRVCIQGEGQEHFDIEFEDALQGVIFSDKAFGEHKSQIAALPDGFPWLIASFIQGSLGITPLQVQEYVLQL
jgi:hypothetical protein